MFTKRHGKVMRAQVGVMLAFYALAVCRGLIPGLCATQNALNARFCANTGESSAAETCCTRTPLPESGEFAIFASSGNHIDCAFCSLITTTARPTHAPIAIDPVLHLAPVCTHALAAPDLAHTWDPASRRGPPFLA